MRVKFRVTISDGEGERFESGREYDVDDDRAKGWLDHKPPFVERADGEDGDPAPSRRRAPRKATAKQAAAKPDSKKEEPVKTDDDGTKTPPAKKAPAKRAARKPAKKTAVNQAPSTAAKED